MSYLRVYGAELGEHNKGACADEHSYGQLMRSWSVMGGSAILNYLISLLRVKIVAIYLGPSGVGLIGLYLSGTDLVATIFNGISSSAVREIVRAQDEHSIARTVRTLRRACWVVGLCGWLLAITLARPISDWLFHSTSHAVTISILGVTLVFNALFVGRVALLQGLRRIEDVAWTNISSALLSTALAVGLYAWLGENGILPVLIATSLISFGVSCWFSRRVKISSAALSWAGTCRETKQLLRLGSAFIFIAIAAAGVDLFARTIIANGFGIHAAGIYQAAWALSGTFSAVVLSAMSADYYPRLSSIIHDSDLATQLVNRQLELAVLITLPALLVTLTFAPAIMEILYTEQFLEGAEVLRWMMLGAFCKALSWPLGFLPLAKGSARLAIANQALWALTQGALLLWLSHAQGLVGVGQASAAALALQGLLSAWVGRKLVGFAWSSAVKRLIVVSFAFISAVFACEMFIKGITALAAAGLITLIGCVFCLRSLAERLNTDNPLIRGVSCMPGGWIILGRPK
ncbi:MAG TPA: O-antigen translocase [Candidatus Acidoferrales bacterium]|jgi:enterobacterial common antigen flippase|nr:O-antigen translocase [Candidatus Acidoferrales bacterium]